MAHHMGSSAESTKARTLAADREEDKKSFQQQQDDIKQANQVKLKDINSLFHMKNAVSEDTFKASTVGLVSAADFKRKRVELDELNAQIELAKGKVIEREKKRKDKERQKAKKSLSFKMDDGEEEDTTASAASSSSSSSSAAAASSSSSSSSAPASKRAKVSLVSSKDPTADTSFLPDLARDAAELVYRNQLAAQWSAEQATIKTEQLIIVYSYWDGSGHRNKIQVNKGSTIGQFLEKVRKEIVADYHELRSIGGDGLMYIKEDLIIPHQYSFYDLIVTKARGKSGPLFSFDVHDDVRMTIDASVEKDESHAGKIVTKGYYERNKLNFPASRWEMFDPSIVRDNYSIKGGEVRGAFAPK